MNLLEKNFLRCIMHNVGGYAQIRGQRAKPQQKGKNSNILKKGTTVMKKILSVLLCGMLLLPCATMAQEEENPYNKSEYTLSLQQAIELAREDNPQFITYDTKIEDAKVQLKQSKYDVINTPAVANISTGLNIMLIHKNYYVNQAQNTLVEYEMEKTQAEKQQAYNVTEKYYGVKLAEALLNTAQTSYELVQTNYETVKTQFDLGMAAELDVSNAELALMQAKAAVDSYQRSLETARDALRIELQIENDEATLILTDEISTEEFAPNLDEDIKQARESRYDLTKLKHSYEQSLVYQETTGAYGMRSPQYSAATSTVRQCDYYYTNTKKQISLLIKNAYNSAITAKDNLNVAQKKRELKEQEYSVVNIKYGLGMATNTEVTNALNALASADIELENAKLSYKLATEKYGYEISIGL